ncbi:hypothetical protein [Tolumonas osonensis]|uniref:DUF1311 domain-containing protein n=1 Tax=Tolumonas osonensis TaxID=675874 RepID=A0A841GPV4_9GAMM|nr:hypothetical protein [Tolumonas osonensis]MBB6056930.1 hypothetical protein [Tolumonas osonensis]
MKKDILLLAILLSFSCHSSEYGVGYTTCIKESDGSTENILTCIKSEYADQRKQVENFIIKNFKQDKSMFMSLEKYNKSLDSAISDKCNVYFLLDGDRGSISEAQCELDELLTYKKLLNDFYEMHNAG